MIGSCRIKNGLPPTRWTWLLGGWISGFSASLDGCAPGLSGQDAFQWGSRSGFSLSQGPEEHDRPGSTHHQSHRPSHRAFYVQPDSVGAPPLAHDDGDERGRQSSLPRPSGFVWQPVFTSCGELCWTLHGSSEVVRAMQDFLPKRTNSSSSSSRPRPAPKRTAKPTQTDPEPRPPQDRLGSGASKILVNSQAERGEPSLATAGPPRKQPLLCLSISRCHTRSHISDIPYLFSSLFLRN